MLDIFEADRCALLALIGAAPVRVLWRFHSRVAGLEFSLRPGNKRDPTGPRIPVSVPVGSVSRTGWLISIERPSFEDPAACAQRADRDGALQDLSLIHISEPTRLGMISYAVFCLKKK